jgi:DNA-binding response OmpR family regulator
MGAEVRSQGHALGVEELVTEEEGFDILVFDIDLPERTGIDCLRDLRGAGVETPCLLITGGTREAPTSMSGTDFLRKPFRIEELRKAILGLISRRSGD